MLVLTREENQMRSFTSRLCGVLAAEGSLMRLLLSALVALLLVGCQVTDKRAQSFMVGFPTDKPKQFILLGAGKYEGDLTFALIEQGFSVKPIAVTQRVTELETPTRMVAYKEAGYRYALKVSMTHDYAWHCVFSGAHRVNATMSVIDIETNEILAVVRQVGPDGSCPPLTPVWPLLAKELARIWK